ncbi:conserved hypothetical protein [Chlamydia felis Fe/C-56]|uniref:Transmembrane protein n=1 Tax=Chlamydia felis (strain Fe/C-56) TaxID=264202 RepID=Q254S5_CHLFF|nr:DUF687 domain-containing protein [Chlamydia felis]BAE81213.1 conserved hypothetical protein [Chlamydia felis Fe/C-56]
MVTPVRIPTHNLTNENQENDISEEGGNNVDTVAIRVEQAIVHFNSSTDPTLGSEIHLVGNDGMYGHSGGNNISEFLCIADTNTQEPADYQVSTTYINGSWQTETESQLEGMHISGLRGEPVRVLYNSGSGLTTSGFLDRRNSVSPTHPLCVALLEVLNSFFSHSENASSRHTIIFYGDGGAYVQQALDYCRFSNRVDCIGIAPTIYVVGHPSVHHFRVTGDLTTLLDRYGYNHSNVSTLGYSAGAEGLILPGLRDPSYQYVLGIRNLFQLNGGPITDPAVAMSLIQMGSDMRDFTQREAEYNNTDNPHEALVNPHPSTCPDILLSGIFLIPSVVAIMQDVFVRSMLPVEDRNFYWITHIGYTAGLVQRLVLMFTNRREVRFGHRRARLLARSLTAPMLLISAAESINYAQRLQRPVPILQAIYFGGAVMSGTWVVLAIGNTCLTRFRARAQRLGLRLMGEHEQAEDGNGERRVVRVADAARRGVAEALPVMCAGVVAGLGAGILNGCSIPSALNNPINATANNLPENRTWIFDGDILRNPSRSWVSGDWFAVSATVSLILGFIVICVSIGVMVASVRRNQYRRT